MFELILAGILGGFGGMVRSTLGLLKALAAKRKIDSYYWGVTALIAVLIGIFTGMIFNFDKRLALLAGYAGTDILEGIFKSLKFEKYVINPAKISK